jgi:hypothetical protein
MGTQELTVGHVFFWGEPIDDGSIFNDSPGYFFANYPTYGHFNGEHNDSWESDGIWG